MTPEHVEVWAWERLLRKHNWRDSHVDLCWRGQLYYFRPDKPSDQAHPESRYWSYDAWVDVLSPEEAAHLELRRVRAILKRESASAEVRVVAFRMQVDAGAAEWLDKALSGYPGAAGTYRSVPDTVSMNCCTFVEDALSRAGCLPAAFVNDGEHCYSPHALKLALDRLVDIGQLPAPTWFAVDESGTLKAVAPQQDRDVSVPGEPSPEKGC